MSRPDLKDDVVAGDASARNRVIRRISATPNDTTAAPLTESVAPTNPVSEQAARLASNAKERSAVIRRIAPLVAPDEPTSIDQFAPAVPSAQAMKAAQSPAIRRLLPDTPDQRDAERIKAIIRPLQLETAPTPAPVSAPRQQEPAKEAPLTKNGTVTCRKCGVKNRADVMFCLVCGAALPAVKGLPESLKAEDAQLRLADRERELDITNLHGGLRPMAWRAAGLSHPGKVRENNEDTIFVEALPDNVWLLIVADGMGGAQAGEVASSVTTTLVRELVESRLAIDASPDVDRRPWLREAIEQANLLLYSHAEEDPALHGMGTTIIVALVQGNTIDLAFVGDSRCYMMRPNGKLEQISVDQSIVAHLVRMGQITQDEGDSHPLRSQLYRVVAANPTLEVSTAIYELERGAKLLISSDGLPLHVSDEEIAQTMRQATTPQDICGRLVALALARGAEDNVSVVALM